MTYTYIDTKLKMPLMDLPVRTTYVSFQDKGVLYSPGSRVSDEQYSNLKVVTDIIAPNLFHVGGIKKALQSFPKATVWVVPGAAEKHNLAGIKYNILGRDSWPYDKELTPILINGMPKVNEVVFFHQQSKTLLVSDLCFNMKNMSGLGPWIILNLFNTYQKFGVSRFFLMLVKDKKLFEDSLGKLFSYEFDKIIVSHGEVVEERGKELLKSCLLDYGYKL